MPMTAPLSAKNPNCNNTKTQRMKTIPQMILSFTLLALVACGGDGDNIIVERNTQKPSATVVNNNRNTTGPKAAQTRYEFPKLKEGYSEVIVHECTLNNKTGEAGVNYSLEWDHHRRATRWVCYQIYASISQSRRHMGHHGEARPYMGRSSRHSLRLQRWHH